ncbi:DNA cytosine methyltransferase [Streptococcus suis]|uniref:DNA cytosine methyltransferase n=1 Tax=Streptococcus suis TaxID=1307 RepID=UPI000768A1BC|nr:DNA cytosine methyltransferase [Streptococcus suis]NQI05878.1 DNA cytosine methyltransferase [Streptococcus suis]CYU09470.1 site-specific DNA methylase [Streptococcus suis]HEL2401539.1 DNA cytosine methyltransferase [Streptococcus suis]HEM2740575.1 DNA cytosine methyltransferase [Streptococcus suis]
MVSVFHEQTQFIDTNKAKGTIQNILNTPLRYNILSLFSGAGGMDFGFKGGFQLFNNEYTENPIDLKYSNDIFIQATQIYRDNFTLAHEIDTTNITEIDLEQLDKKYGLVPNVRNEIQKNPNGIDILLGGFPCQTFSVAGKRAGLNDERGQLYLQMSRFIQHYQPKIFVAENVDGIRNSRNNNLENVDATALEVIMQHFNDIGYNVQYNVLDAADYGVPQSRRRVIIVGVRSDLGDNTNIYYPIPTHANKPRTAFDGLEDIWSLFNTNIIPNHNWNNVSHAKFYSDGKKRQGNNQILRDAPAPTIRAEHHGNIEAHYNMDPKYINNPNDPNDKKGWRRLSVRECARLQSFPDNFIFNTSTSSAYKAIGNAVPPILAWHIANAIIYSLYKIENFKE